MAAAETARLIASLELQDKLTPGAKTATSAVNGLERATNATTVRVGVLQGATSKLGGAMSHAVGQVGGLVRSVGILGGALGIGGLVLGLKSSVENAAEFGAGVSKVAAVTNQSAEAASAMVDTLEKWGIAADKQVTILGRAEKNAGALGATTKKAAAFQKTYGFNLLGTNGQIVDANELLLRSADLFTSNASATDKATVLTKLWGKTWVDLVPLLSKGRAGIEAEEKSAIHLTTEQIANIAKFRDAQRDFSDTLGDIQVKIGANLMPVITRGLKEAGSWLDSHGDEVAKFFGDAAGFAEKAAGGIAQVFSGLKAAWDSVPSEVRDLLIKGIAADRTIKFLFGFSPVGAAGGLLGKGFDQFLSRGASPVNPLWVQQVGGPGGGGGNGPGPNAPAANTVRDILDTVSKAAVLATVYQGVFKGIQNIIQPQQVELQNRLPGTAAGLTPFQMVPGMQFDIFGNISAISDWIQGKKTPDVHVVWEMPGTKGKGVGRLGDVDPNTKPLAEHAASVPAARLIAQYAAGKRQMGDTAVADAATAVADKFDKSTSPSLKSMIDNLSQLKEAQKGAPAALAEKLQGPIDSISSTLREFSALKPPVVTVTVINQVSARATIQSTTIQNRYGPANIDQGGYGGPSGGR